MPGDLQTLIDKAKGDVLYKIFKNDDNSQFSDDERLVNQHTQDAFEGKRDLLQKDNCTCPIMLTPLSEPVRPIYEDGKSQYVYEREAIEKWNEANGTEPLSRIPIQELRPDREYMKPIIADRLLKCFNEYCNGLSDDEREKVDSAIDNVMYIVLNKELIKELEKGDFYLNWNLIRQYLNDGANINILNRNGDSLLQIAAVYQSLELVRFLVDNGANINHQGSCYYTALHKAIKKERVDIVKYFLSLKNIDLKLKNTEGLTPLNYATQVGNLEIVEALLKDHTIPNNEKETALDCLLKKQTPQELLNLAIEDGLLKLAELSIDAGADVNNTWHGISLLQYSTQRGNLEIVKHLLKNGACINYQDSFRGNTAMHEAASNGSLEIVKLLLEYDADAEVADERGDKPIHIAVQNLTITHKYEVQ